MTITFRPMQPDDRQFVISGWSSSYRKSRTAGLIRNSSWARVMHPEIEAYLDLPDTRTIVACEPGELDHLNREFLYGFIATRTSGRPYVYYTYVKLPYRRRDIARRLFAAAGIDPREHFECAVTTPIGDHILATCACGRRRVDHDGTITCGKFVSKAPGAVWDPVPAREAA